MPSLKIVFLIQAGTGIVANALLIFSHIFTFFSNHRIRLTDLITCHLACVHITMLLTTLLTLNLLVAENVHNDFKCKVFFYMHRVMRNVSICTTCLLSVLQAITISPRTSWMARLKQKVTDHISQMFAFLWFISSSCGYYLMFYTVASSNTTQTNHLVLNKYCSLSPMSSIIKNVTYIMITSSDIFFIGIMLVASVYMVNLLFRHQRQLQHFHGNCLLRFSPEKRATKTILLVVSFFVVLYWMHLVLLYLSTMVWVNGPVVLGIQNFVVNVYATVSPLLLIHSDKRITNILQCLQQKFRFFKYSGRKSSGK